MKPAEGQGKVFGIGLSKTGTTSLYAALQMLGYRTATFRHMRQLGLDDWLAGDFTRDYFAGHDAVTDLPVGTYFRELDARYPGSRFVLTLRPVEPWLATIEKQFRANPDPAGFNRDVRLGAYGVTTFNADRFARLHAEHQAAVRAWFADRPEDLLVLDLFEGHGWPELCGFLDRPVPAEPFPNVKPGHDQPLNRAAHEGGPFTFVIPVVHPEGPKVADYALVETALKASLTSYLAQDGADCAAVVVAHRRPAWADAFGARLHFIDLGDHPGFAPGANAVQEDKGMKYTLGALYAAQVLGAGEIMLVDADDYARRDLVTAVRPALETATDGVIVTRGVHALVAPDTNGLNLRAAFQIDQFDISCGTCRVFHARALLGAIHAAVPGAEDAGFDDHAPTPALLAAVTQAGTASPGDKDSLIHTLGRHVWQDTHFALSPLALPLVAKACGHGNHDGHRGGDIHWHRIRKLSGRASFLRRYGLEGALNIDRAPDIKAVLTGAARVIWRKLRGRLGRA